MKNPIVIFAVLMVASILGGYFLYSSYLSPEMDRRESETKKNAELIKKLDEARTGKERTQIFEKTLRAN